MIWGIPVAPRGPYYEHYYVYSPGTEFHHPMCHPSGHRYRQKRIVRDGRSPRGKCPTCVVKAPPAAVSGSRVAESEVVA